jgi:hypothetical protein
MENQYLKGWRLNYTFLKVYCPSLYDLISP